MTPPVSSLAGEASSPAPGLRRTEPARHGKPGGEPAGGAPDHPVYDEPRLLLVSLDHRLAGRERVALDNIADEPLPKVHGARAARDHQGHIIN